MRRLNIFFACALALAASTAPCLADPSAELARRQHALKRKFTLGAISGITALTIVDIGYRQTLGQGECLSLYGQIGTYDLCLPESINPQVLGGIVDAALLGICSIGAIIGAKLYGDARADLIEEFSEHQQV